MKSPVSLPHFLSSISERDIDLLVLEELHASAEFRAWLLRQLPRPVEELTFLGAAHSIADRMTGESDIEVFFEKKDGERIFLLIENKLAAAFQPGQPSRYVQRGELYVNQGRCTEFITCLLAPNAYLRSATAVDTFATVLSYEALRDWFAEQNSQAARARYKVSVLDFALANQKRAYQMVVDPQITAFWRHYWVLHRKLAPELNMEEPAQKGPQSTWIYVKPAGFPSGTTIVHKLTHGRIELQLEKKRRPFTELQQDFGSVPQPWFWEDKPKFACLVRLVPRIDARADFLEQLDSIVEGMRAAQDVLAWYRMQRSGSAA